MRNLVGQVVGEKYRVLRHVGIGGIAEVYEAVHEMIGQHFALKVLRPEYASMRDIADRMLVEARAASAVGHPGIVQVFDIGSLETGEPYLVMELLQGEDLADILRHRKRLAVDKAVAVCLHILDALAAAHKAGVVHRDLKPENVVLVRGPSGEPWAKIIDFGIARLTREGGGGLRQTSQGVMLGTPYYISPEQARGSPTIDGRADLYALGVMLFEMITGQLPFNGSSAEEIIVKALGEPFPKPREIMPELPVALEEIILRATARNRDQRFQTAEEFAEALRPLRGELVAVEMLPDEDQLEFDDDPSVIRRLDELAARVPAGERIRARSVPPPPDGRRPSYPPGSGRRPSNPPPERYPSYPPGSGRYPSSPPASGRLPSNAPSASGRYPSVSPSKSGRYPAVERSTGRHPLVTPSGGRRPSVPPVEGEQRRPSVPPPPPRLSSRPGSVPGTVPAAVTVSAPKTLLTAAIVGTAAAAAVAGILVLAFARGPAQPSAPTRPAPAVPASTDGAHPPPVAVAPPPPAPPPPAPPPPPVADASSPPPVVDAAADQPVVPDATTASTVRLLGLPKEASATVDGRPVGEEFQLEPSVQRHVLRVLIKGRVVFTKRFVAQEDTTVEVRVPRRYLTESVIGADAGSTVPPPPPPPPSQDGGTGPLANPFQ